MCSKKQDLMLAYALIQNLTRKIQTSFQHIFFLERTTQLSELLEGCAKVLFELCLILSVDL